MYNEIGRRQEIHRYTQRSIRDTEPNEKKERDGPIENTQCIWMILRGDINIATILCTPWFGLFRGKMLITR